MKKRLPILIIAIFTCNYLVAKTKLSLEGGLNVSFFTEKKKSVNPYYPEFNGKYSIRYASINPDFRIGCNFQNALSKRFSLQYSLFYVVNHIDKSYILTYYRNSLIVPSYYPNPANKTADTFYRHTRLHALQLPLLALYETKVKKKNHLVFGLGGYLQLNMIERINLESSRSSSSTIGSGMGDIRRLDFGPKALVRYELKNRVFICAGYEMSAINMVSEANMRQNLRTGNQLRHSNAFLTIGYIVGYLVK